MADLDAAVILAGGGARRMGGLDKAMEVVDGVPLLARVIAACRGAGAAHIVVVGTSRPDIKDVSWAREDPPGCGPVAGLAAGLAALPKSADSTAAASGATDDGGAADRAHTAAASGATEGGAADRAHTAAASGATDGGAADRASTATASGATDGGAADRASMAAGSGAADGAIAATAAGRVAGGGMLVGVLAADLPFVTAADLRALADAAPAVAVDDDGREQWLLGVHRDLRLPRDTAGVSMRSVLDTPALGRVRLSRAATMDCDTEADLERARGAAWTG